MTKSFSTNPNNDIFISPDGQLSISSDLSAVLQACQQAAQAQLGEMVLSIDQGVPNFQTIWRDAANVAQFEAYVRRALQSVTNVLEVSEFNSKVSDNKISYSATILTTFGRAQLNG